MRNEHKVVKAQWDSWAIGSQAVFNSVYQQMIRTPMLFLHPKTKRLPTREWKTICWNAAWTAADACQDIPSTVYRSL